MDIKIVTINTWKCDGEYRNRLPILSRQLKQIAPDVIACQECFLSEEAGADTAASLARELGMQYSFVACRSKKRHFDGRQVDSYSGMAVLSRFPIVSRNVFDLPAIPEDPGRKAQQVELELLPGKKMLITNVHLTHLPGQTDLRKRQVTEVCKRAAAGADAGKNTSAAGKVLYSLICGDFNAGMRSAELALLKDEAHAADCYVLGGGREPRTSLLESFKAGRSDCVDYIFCLPVRRTKEGTKEANSPPASSYPLFKNAAIVLNEPDTISGLYPSDHFGISTVLVTEFIPL